MANSLRRADVVRALTEANIAFDPEATMVQLRPLYDDLIAEIGQNRGNNVQQRVQLNELGPDGVQQMQNNPDETDERRQQREALQQQQQMQQTQPDANVSVHNRLNLDWNAEEAEIDRQLAIARKKRELMELQRELVQIEKLIYTCLTQWSINLMAPNCTM